MWRCARKALARAGIGVLAVTVSGAERDTVHRAAVEVHADLAGVLDTSSNGR